MKLKKLMFTVLTFLVSMVFSNIVFADENVSNKNVLRVGMEVGYAPFNWYQTTDENGAVKISTGFANGYDVQIAKLIAKELNRELVIVPSDWDSLLGPALNSNKIDLVIAGMSPTNERKKSLDFSNSYYESDVLLVVKKDSPYVNGKTKKDFKNARITGQLNTLHYDLIDQLEGVDKKIAIENFPAMQVALNSNKIDAYVAEKPTAISVSFSNPNMTYIEFSDGGFDFDRSEFDVSIAAKKGETKLIDEVNLALSKINKNTREKLMREAIANQPVSNKNSDGNFNETTFLGRTKQILNEYGVKYLYGTWTTIYLAVIGTFVGSLIGIVIAIVNTTDISDKRKKMHNIFYYILKKINYVYILVFRGTPMIVQAMIFYYGIGQVFNINLSPIVAALIIISINTGAYISEIFRGGIESIDKGQYDATEALGFTHKQAMRYVIIPQAIKNVLPSIGNEFIINIKDSAVLFAIGVTELYTVSKQIAGTNFRYYEVFIITCSIYFVLTTVCSRLLKILEKKLAGDSSYEIVE
ncbi:ABC transporter substrate-binding protein/permease [Oceanivirga salmonicida]|uniref:ABC transporter substrate-binding protein/permease n=1 Tax=Oceanivirga salmonicida TaxID=1769291 RepID=UPI0008345FF4|nr:ABC transporter substrate-binding protein/permease [Oceanivirga salmonicida]